MTNEQERILNDFREKLRILTTVCDRAKSENAYLKSKVEELSQKAEAKSKEFDELSAKYENLKVLNTLLGGENSHETKIKLNRIVREIDKCIALLNKVN